MKTYYIAGIANKKSIACFVAKQLIKQGHKVILSAQNESNLTSIKKLFPDAPSFIYNVEDNPELLTCEIEKITSSLDGFVHSIAFGHFEPVAFHETKRKYFLQATQISAFSLVEMSNAILPFLNEGSSVVTLSISDTRATSYGYLGPIKAMLDSTVAFLAKSLSDKKIRVNAVKAGPLKTSASAGIPNYIENYLFAEELTMRKKSLDTNEVASMVSFLISEASSGVNAQALIIDAGMNANYFDQRIVKKFSES